MADPGAVLWERVTGMVADSDSPTLGFPVYYKANWQRTSRTEHSFSQNKRVGCENRDQRLIQFRSLTENLGVKHMYRTWKGVVEFGSEHDYIFNNAFAEGFLMDI